MQNALSADKMCHLPALCHFGRSGAQIKSAVRLQILSFLRVQSIACLLYSIPYSALSLPKSPLTKAALPGPEKEPRGWVSHNHQSHCSGVSVCLILSVSVYVELICLPPAVTRVRGHV